MARRIDWFALQDIVIAKADPNPIPALAARPALAAPQPRIVGYRKRADAFELAFPTATGFQYTVEHATAPQPTTWSSLPSVQGSGAEVTVTHANPTSGTGYCRMRVEWQVGPGFAHRMSRALQERGINGRNRGRPDPAPSAGNSPAWL